MFEEFGHEVAVVTLLAIKLMHNTSTLILCILYLIPQRLLNLAELISHSFESLIMLSHQSFQHLNLAIQLPIGWCHLLSSTVGIHTLLDLSYLFDDVFDIESTRVLE